MQYCLLLLLGSIIYRSARGTKHFGYRPLETELSERSGPMQRSVTSVHPKRHERRAEGITGFRMHGRSNISNHKVAPLASVNKEEHLLISFDDDCSIAPQTTSTVTGTQRPVSQGNVDVLSLLDSSVAEKYERLPPALGEQRRVPYDPFEISEDLKNYASQTATPLHGNSVTASQQNDTSSLHHSWSSFDSFSSQDTNNDNEIASPAAASASDRMFGSVTAGSAFAAGDAGTNMKTGSDTDLLMYANIPLRPRDDNRGRQMSNYGNRHSYSYSDADKRCNRRSRRRNRNDHLASREVDSDVNANLVVPRPVSVDDSIDWVNNVSQLSVQNATAASQSAAAVSPTFGQTLAASTAAWDGKSLSRHMKAAKKKMPNTGSVFYDAADDDHGNADKLSSCWDYSSGNSAPPVPPRDYLREDTTHATQSSDAVYANVVERNPGGVNYDISGTRQLAEVRPFVQASSDVYQNYSEFSQSNADNAARMVYANVRGEQSSVHRGSRSGFVETTARGDVGRSGDGTGLSTVQRVRRHVPAATVDECQTALVSCYGDVETAVRHLKLEQLTRLGIAPRERCQMLLEACSWDLESAGSILLHELTAGSPV